jgi:hypothetical protein
LTPKGRISGLTSGSNHDNGGDAVVVEHIILPTALLVMAVVALGAGLVYIFSWQQRR